MIDVELVECKGTGVYPEPIRVPIPSEVVKKKQELAHIKANKIKEKAAGKRHLIACILIVIVGLLLATIGGIYLESGDWDKEDMGGILMAIGIILCIPSVFGIIWSRYK